MMSIHVVWRFVFCIVLIAFDARICECKMDITYEGKKYVSENYPFTISCFKSAYGVPKWTRNGVTITSQDTDYTVSEENLPSGSVHMQLRVNRADWRHRGTYKCDPQSTSSLTIDIVVSRETDNEMQTQLKIPLRINKTLRLICDLEEKANFPINWYKDGKRILESEKDPRVRLEGRTLWISKANKSDTGEYTCVIESSGRSYSIADHLGSHTKVTYPPEAEQFSVQTRPIFRRNFILECKVQGFPVPRMAWFVDDVRIEEYRRHDSRYDVTENVDGLPNSVFTIKDVNYGDNHKITCTAENLEGSAETVTELAVRANTISTNEDEPGKGILLTIGQDLIIQCNNTDTPSARIEWSKNGAALNMSDTRIHIDDSTNSLIISNTAESDCGNYTCASEDTQAVIAVKTKVMLKPMDTSRNVDQNRNIVLICNVTQGTPLPTIRWLKGADPLNISDSRITIKTDVRGIEGTEVIIGDARFDDRAEYTCIAANEVNTVNATILIRVKDKYAALWPFLGICAEVAILCTIIFIYEKRRQKPDFDESETEQNTENKSVHDQEDKGRDVRQRK